MTEWDEIGWNRTQLQSVGINVPFNDIIVATVALGFEPKVQSKHSPQVEQERNGC